MKQLPNIGPNQTGIESAPQRAMDMLEARDMFQPLIEGGIATILEERIEYAREGKTGTGSVPPLYGKEEELAPALVLLLDKLGARITAERTGTRLYDALLSKHQAYGSFDRGPSERDLEQIQGQRRRHLAVLFEAIETLGGDPTAVTPSANLAGMVARGYSQVLTDPRTNLLQCLETMAMAEQDNLYGWERLIEIARMSGMPDLAERFEVAREEEAKHVRMVSGWISEAYRMIGSGGES